jgi:hypothetical protein
MIFKKVEKLRDLFENTKILSISKWHHFILKKLLSENMCFTLKEKNKTMSFHTWVKTIASHLVWPFCMLLFLLCFFLFMLLARLWPKFSLSHTSQECKKKKKNTIHSTVYELHAQPKKHYSNSLKLLQKMV